MRFHLLSVDFSWCQFASIGFRLSIGLGGAMGVCCIQVVTLFVTMIFSEVFSRFMACFGVGTGWAERAAIEPLVKKWLVSVQYPGERKRTQA